MLTINTRTATNQNTYKQAGFSLIELLVVVAIIGILTRIALPVYSDYITKSRIIEATSGLAGKRVAIEQYYDNNRTYANAPACTADSTTSFTFSCTTATTSAYTLVATGTGKMAGFVFTVNEKNEQKTTGAGSGWNTSDTCWIKAKDGSC